MSSFIMSKEVKDNYRSSACIGWLWEETTQSLAAGAAVKCRPLPDPNQRTLQKKS